MECFHAASQAAKYHYTHTTSGLGESIRVPQILLAQTFPRFPGDTGRLGIYICRVTLNSGSGSVFGRLNNDSQERMEKPDASQDRCYNVMHRRLVLKFCKIAGGGNLGYVYAYFPLNQAPILGNQNRQ